MTVAYAWLGFVSISLFFNLSGDIIEAKQRKLELKLEDEMKYIVPWKDFLCVYTAPKVYTVQVVILLLPHTQ